MPRSLFLLGLGFFSAGCITFGRPLPIKTLDQLTPCLSTEAEIVAMMGEPYERGRSLTYRTLRYVHVKTHLLGQKPYREDLLFYLTKEGRLVDFVLNPIAQIMALPDRCATKDDRTLHAP